MNAVCASTVSLTSGSPTVILRGPILFRQSRATGLAQSVEGDLRLRRDVVPHRRRDNDSGGAARREGKGEFAGGAEEGRVGPKAPRGVSRPLLDELDHVAVVEVGDGHGVGVEPKTRRMAGRFDPHLRGRSTAMALIAAWPPCCQ